MQTCKRTFKHSLPGKAHSNWIISYISTQAKCKCATKTSDISVGQDISTCAHLINSRKVQPFAMDMTPSSVTRTHLSHKIKCTYSWRTHLVKHTGWSFRYHVRLRDTRFLHLEMLKSPSSERFYKPNSKLLAFPVCIRWGAEKSSGPQDSTWAPQRSKTLRCTRRDIFL